MTRTYKLEGLCCANCAAKIERKVAKIKGVSDVSLNFMMQKISLETEITGSELTDEITSIVSKIEKDVMPKEI